jgi:hypothetical protein
MMGAVPIPRQWRLHLCAALLVVACGPSSSGNSKVPAGARSSGGLHAVIDTDRGAITIEFFPEDAPKAVENFRLLAEHGYYDGLTFHRIVEGFMIQGGDPAGDGTGGQSAWGPPFEDEIDADSALYRTGYRRGIVAMANAGPRYQRQPVLHPAPGLPAPAALRDLREGDGRHGRRRCPRRHADHDGRGWRQEPAPDAAGHQDGDDSPVSRFQLTAAGIPSPAPVIRR